MRTGKPCLSRNQLITNVFSSPCFIASGKPSGDGGPSETRTQRPFHFAKQTAQRQTLLKPRDFPASRHPWRRHSVEELAGEWEPRRNSLPACRSVECPSSQQRSEPRTNVLWAVMRSAAVSGPLSAASIPAMRGCRARCRLLLSGRSIRWTRLGNSKLSFRLYKL